MTPKQRERILILTAVICVAAFAGDRLVLTPLIDLWNTRAEKITNLQDMIENGQRLLNRERSLRKTWRIMQRDALPDDIAQAQNQIVKCMDRWVTDSRVKQSSLKPNWKQYEENYRTLESSAVVQGELSQIQRFLYELETDDSPVKIDQCQLITRNDNDNRLTLSLRFSAIQFLEEEEQ